MAERKRQYSTYTDVELGDKIEATAKEHGVSVAKLLREGARRQIDAFNAADNNGGSDD